MSERELDEIRHRPGTGSWGRSLQVLLETDSTNRVAWEAALAGAPHGHLVAAETQTAGRGRLGRSWVSASGLNLLVSFVLRPSVESERLGWIPLAAGMAVAQTVMDFVPGRRVRVKWPNDVRIDGLKVAGILAEGRIDAGDEARGFVVLGIGLNVNQTEFPIDLAATATSLARMTGNTIDRVRVLAVLCDRLEAGFRQVSTGSVDLHRTYESMLDGMGGEVDVTVGPDRWSGRMIGVDKWGCLKVETSTGTRTFASGEATLRPFEPSSTHP